MLGKSEYPASGGSTSAPISLSVATLPTEITADGLVRSEFIDAIRAQFIGTPGQPKYPDGPPAQAVDKVIRELPEALAAMLSVLEDGDNFPENPVAGSAIALVATAAAATGWPNGGAKIPSEFTLIAKFRRYEMAAAMNLMTQAYFHKGVGGGSSGFPPEKP